MRIVDLWFGGGGFWRGADNVCGTGDIADFVSAVGGALLRAFAFLWDDDLLYQSSLCGDGGGVVEAEVPAVAIRASGGGLRLWDVHRLGDVGVFLLVLPELCVTLGGGGAGQCGPGIGIALQIHANLVFNPGEGCVKALCQVLHARFAWLKIAFEVSLVLMALILSLSALHGVFGLREGTLVAAFVVGLSLRWAMPLCRPAKKLLLVPVPRHREP